MHIEEVKSKRQLRQFVGFPDSLYASCPQYVPALHADQYRSLTKSASLEYCPHCLWLAINDDGKVAGRISAFINPRYNELYGKKCCRFGWFDTVEDLSVAKALIETATRWAAERGMTHLHGPLYYNTLGKQGMLVEGFDNIPQANTIYNYPYYPVFMEKLGFSKECDWVQKVVRGCALPERIEKLADILQRRYDLHFESVAEMKKDHSKVMAFMKEYSDSFAQSVYNFIPFTPKEMEEEAKESLSMLDGRYCQLLYDSEGDLAAFGISFPSPSKALQKARGRLFPFGWYHLLRAVKGHNDTVDLMINGVTGKWHGKGLSSIYHKKASEDFTRLGAEWFITNPQIEGNSAVNVWENYPAAQPFMRRRCYIKEI